MHRFVLAKRAWLALLAAVCAVYFYHIGSYPLLGPDEPRYAQVAREMFERGDPVTPTLGGLPWFEKPALLYWMMMGAYALFGVTEFAARAGSALSGIATVLLAGWAGLRAERESGTRLRGLGLACAAVTASCAGLIVFSHAATFDIVLTATTAAALACFYASEVGRRGRGLALAGFYASVGLSLLAKGLVGLVIPAGVVVFYHLLRRRLPDPLRLGAVWGVFVAAAVAAAWYAPVWLRHGEQFFDAFVVQHHFARYLSNRYSHPQPFYFYLPITLMLALPWTFFFVRGLLALAGTNWHADDPETKLRALALAWVVVPVAFFSLSGSKLPGYVLPALPGAMLLAGTRALAYLRGEGELLTMRLTGALALALLAGGVGYAISQGLGAGAGPVPAGCVAAVVTPAAFVCVVALFHARRRELAFFSVVGATLVTVAIIAACALKPVARPETVAPLLAEADAAGYQALPVYFMRTPERTSQFYAAGRVAYGPDGELWVLDEPEDLTRAMEERRVTALVVVPLEFEYKVTGARGVQVRRLGDNGGHALYLAGAEGERE